MGHRGICEFHQLKVIFRSINRKMVSGEVGKLSLSLVKIE